LQNLVTQKRFQNFAGVLFEGFSLSRYFKNASEFYFFVIGQHAYFLPYDRTLVFSNVLFDARAAKQHPLVAWQILSIIVITGSESNLLFHEASL